MNAGKVGLSILAGIATGALVGILFAPDKGSNTRKKIVSKSEDYVDNVKEKFNGLLDTMKERYESIKSEAENLEENGKEKYAEVKADFNNAMS